MYTLGLAALGLVVPSGPLERQAHAAGSHVIVPDAATVEAAPAYRYGQMTNEEALAELDRRKVPYVTVPAGSAPGVRAPVRLTGRLHGVSIHGTAPEAERATSIFEICDARLALALDDFAKVLERHDIDELLHFTMFRYNVAAAPEHGTTDAKLETAAKKKAAAAPAKPQAKAADKSKPGEKPAAKAKPGDKPTDKPTDKSKPGERPATKAKPAENAKPPSKPTEKPKPAPAAKPAAKPKGAWLWPALPTPMGDGTLEPASMMAKGAPPKRTASAPAKPAAAPPKAPAKPTPAKPSAPAGKAAGKPTPKPSDAAKPSGMPAHPPAAKPSPGAAAKPSEPAAPVKKVNPAPPGTRHPAGLAIDVGALHKRGGGWLSVANHFGGSIGAPTCGEGVATPRSAEARELRSIVCEAFDLKLFTYTLTPHYDTAHADHFHMEVKIGARWFGAH